MLNIHFKIEAKKTVEINLLMLQKISGTTFKKAIENLYISFDKDYFMLPYKVRKLSKRARRNTTVKAV